MICQLNSSLAKRLCFSLQNMSIILDTLRTAPPPQPSAQNPLLTSVASGVIRGEQVPVPKAPVLPLSPVQYLTTIIDSVAPLVKVRQQKGIAGGGASVPIPIPLNVKQRRRTAMQWLLDAVEKRRETRLADRIAKELISIAEGKSSLWTRRQLVHKNGITARSNVRLTMMGPRPGRKKLVK